MRVHLAGLINAKYPVAVSDKLKATGSHLMPGSGEAWNLCATALVTERCANSLVTYAYADGIDTWHNVWREVPSNVIVDSGAFTAHTQGTTFTVEGYAAFIDEFGARYGSDVADANFMSLDVIGDTKATWRNFDHLTRLGKSVMPVLTLGCSLADVDRAAEHGYVACGGLVGGGRADLMPWLDGVFGRFRKLGKLPKVHLLGITKQWALERYPAYSCDSSTWLSPLRFGRTLLKGIDRLPRHKDGVSESAIVVEALRAEVRKYRELENQTTALWRRRGIEWQS